MFHLLEYLDFSDDAALALDVGELVLVVDLDGQGGAERFVHAFFHDCVGALA